MDYLVLAQQKFVLDEYSIVPLREEDILSIKEWRNAQMAVLRQKRELTDQDQLNYYSKVIYPLFASAEPAQILFSYLLKNVCIGYGGLTNMDWEAKRTELSYLVDPGRISDEQLYCREFGIFITLIKRVVFEHLKFNRIFTETYDIRPTHIRTLEQNGFRLEGKMKEHILIDNKFENSLIHGFLKQYYYA